ncbi:MAG: Nucleotide-binding protein TIR-like protein [Chthonomonadaceae bacterium]|nr:Nucleotide-binding protein TIR-like protein [Chthonomonadaceae bacterium]
MEPNTEVVEQKPIHKNEVFVIHGRNAAIRQSVERFLRSVGITPIEWDAAITLTRSPNPYTWQIVDAALTAAAAIIVLFTPDDEAKLRDEFVKPTDEQYESELTPQPRTNVLFEAGVAFGRSAQHTLMVSVGKIRPISDLAGHHILRLDNSPEKRLDFIKRLQNAGCEVDMRGSAWLKEGDFELSTPVAGTIPSIITENPTNAVTTPITKASLPHQGVLTKDVVPAPDIKKDSTFDSLFTTQIKSGPPSNLTQWQHIQEALRNMKSIMVSRATGSVPDENDYANTRSYLLKMVTPKELLPTSVVNNRTVAEYWAYIQPKAPKYRERTTVIQDEFADILTYAETQIQEGH